MYIRVVYTAKIGKDRETREVGIHTNSNGDMNLTFDKDIDWGAPVFMILEPAEALELPPFMYCDDKCTENGKSAEYAAGKIVEYIEANKEVAEWLTQKKAEAESKRPFVNYGDEMREKLKKREES